MIRCELDAACFHLYFKSTMDWLHNFPNLSEMLPTPRDAVEYIMEGFPIIRRKDIARFGNYRTKSLILDLFDRMQQAIESDMGFQTSLAPPPGPPIDGKGNFISAGNFELTHIHHAKEEGQPQ